MVTKNRKIYNVIKEQGYTDDDIDMFCQGYLELMVEAMTDGLLGEPTGVKENRLSNKMLKDKLVYKRNGKLYVEE